VPLFRILPLVLIVCYSSIALAQGKRPRLTEEKPAGKREKLSLGTLFLPDGFSAAGKVPLFLHFHGPGWIAEVAAARAGDLAVLHAQLGTGSAVYGKPFQDPKRLRDLLAEAEKKAGRQFELVGLTGWSAGYGAVRAILRVEEYYRQVRWVVLMDGLHAGYTADKKPIEVDLDCYVRLAKDAAAGHKRFLVTHTRIALGKFASTTETADLLIAKVGGKRGKPAMVTGLPVESEMHDRGLTILSCSGAAAPDHVDHLHALPRLLAEVAKARR
jgi:hypothetical protein